MGIEMIGKQIATLRKEKGIKQEELANYVGVTTHAVSKWENGGVPDTELLPIIADFFSISVDSLFGRNITNYGDLSVALCKKIVEAPVEERFNVVFDYCWDVERALYGNIPKDGETRNRAEYVKDLKNPEQIYSSIMTDNGYTRMKLAGNLQYFLLVPEIQNAGTTLLDGLDYVGLFKDFSDKDVFAACCFLSKRESNKAFTENLLVKNLKIECDKAKQVIAVLDKYNFIYKTQIEMDDEIQTVYNFKPTPSFIAFLIFARELIKEPNSFAYYSGKRNKPYLK